MDGGEGREWGGGAGGGGEAGVEGVGRGGGVGGGGGGVGGGGSGYLPVLTRSLTLDMMSSKSVTAPILSAHLQT